MLTELRAIPAGWEAGRTRRGGVADPAHRPAHRPLRQFIENIDSTRADLRVEGLRKLTWQGSVLVENLVLLRLHADRRAVRAAGRPEVRRAIEPLGELLGTTTGHAREEILTVLLSLTT
ncbi:hypothetical protein E1292_17550 [Nonomuraea deserti]|uniref:Uncharacterized protein n=1 Tax=Nonomuraea deserti TaxID=1848322 RepID=A0A4R4VQ68_9ACTN|nr:hypothetical protein [Nonomuraea deserti]TDD05263.1 hypothetical protein E1292_17550 [Nonomuraea deserti]